MTTPPPQTPGHGFHPQQPNPEADPEPTPVDGGVMPDNTVMRMAIAMGLGHFGAYASARAHLSALSDNALTIEAAAAYENTLIELDRLHSPRWPIINVDAVSDSQYLLTNHARLAIERLSTYLDPLDLELVLAMLNVAHDLDL